jgi:hypothetical protein
MADCWAGKLDGSHDAVWTLGADNLDYVVDAENRSCCMLFGGGWAEGLLMCKIIVGDKVQQERRKTKERVFSRLYTLGSQGRPSTEHSLYICSLAGLSCGGHAGPLHFLVFAAGDDIANNVVVQRQACYSLQVYLLVQLSVFLSNGTLHLQPSFGLLEAFHD